MKLDEKRPEIIMVVYPNAPPSILRITTSHLAVIFHQSQRTEFYVHVCRQQVVERLVACCTTSTYSTTYNVYDDRTMIQFPISNAGVDGLPQIAEMKMLISRKQAGELLRDQEYP